MRLGDYPARLVKGSRTAEVYGVHDIVERHRHRYEVNRAYEANINRGGLIISGESHDGQLVEFVETTDHPYFLATQAHPEFPLPPNPTAPAVCWVYLEHFCNLVQSILQNKELTGSLPSGIISLI